jgi:hypothetical protein
MSQEEFDKEFVELKERLSIIIELLQEINEYQRRGWNVKKKGQMAYCSFVYEEIDAHDGFFHQNRARVEEEEEHIEFLDRRREAHRSRVYTEVNDRRRSSLL